MSTADFAAVIRAKFPQYADVADDVALARAIVTRFPQYADVAGLSVADAASARLAARGLTPEGIKADPGAMEPQPQILPFSAENARAGVREMVGVDDGTGFDTKLKGEGGMMSGLGHALNPVNIAKGLAQAGWNLVDPMGDMRPDVVPPGSALDLLPDFAGTARESYRRGESGESVSDMYGNTVGAAVLAATPAALARAAPAAGSRLAASAESRYAGITEPPLTESMARQMMDRGIVVRDPKALATRAVAAEEAALAERQAIIDRNPLPERWRSTPARREAAQQVRSAEAEAKFQSDLQTVAETIKTPAKGGNILTGTAGKVLSMIPGVDTAARVIGTVKTLHEFPRSPAFKTATSLAKRKFGQAMQAGDHALAADIGAAISTGALADDEFGHRAAIKTLAVETDALPTPELRRQVVAAKKLSYVDPAGRETPIPHNVAMGLTGATVNEGQSPLSAWLNSMGKQGLIKPGGSIAIR